MYLAKLQHCSTIHYQLRQSFVSEKSLHDYEVIFDLGAQPSDYFSIIEEHIVIFADILLQTLTKALGKDPETLLEKLLFEFFPQAVQHKLNTFKDRAATYRGALTVDEKKAIQTQIHIFDRRRLYYLRYGAVDQSRLSKLHEKCCRPLLGQSRDEREYYFAAEEKVLEPGSYFQYIFAIFNLQTHFQQSFAPWLPEALAMDEVAEQFTRTICSVQKDRTFWQAQTGGEFLHTHLTRYLWMFFDFAPHQPSFQKEFARAFMGNHRTFKWPEKKVEVAPEIIEEIFGISHSHLAALKKEELTSLYRKKAMELHPDKGGDAEHFIILSEVYSTLLGKNRKK